jgi:hypothetical protein
MPPAINTVPSLSNVAVCSYLLVFSITPAVVVTESVAVPETEPELAVIVTVPDAIAVIKPVGLTVAIDGFDEAHVLEAVKSVEEKLEYVPLADNCSVPPMSIVELLGEIVTEVKAAGVTVRRAEPDTVPRAACTVTVPRELADANPVELTVTMLAGNQDHSTAFVISCVVLSVYVPITWYCWLVPSAIEAFDGLIAIEIKAGAPTVTVVELIAEP